MRVFDTSTKPLHAVTDEGPCVIKYMGNPQGDNALVSELIGTELAASVGLPVAEFAVLSLPEVRELPVSIEAGPAFCSRWVEDAMSLSQSSQLIKRLRYPEHIALMVVFDTWIRNADRYRAATDVSTANSNRDNLLLVPDKRKVGLLAIDHTHAFIDVDFEYELDSDWVSEQEPFGIFPQFMEHLSRSDILRAIEIVKSIDRDGLEEIIAVVPSEWGLTTATKNELVDCLLERSALLIDWLPEALLKQTEMDV